MALFDSINDKCWALLDWLWDRKIPIGAAFERYKLPPVLFPLMIILIVLIAFWLIAAPHQSPCGNGLCSPSENCHTCPVDCGECGTNTSSGLVVSVELTGLVTDQITVTIFDKDDRSKGTETGRKALFEFPNIDPQMLGVLVSCPNGKQQTSRPRMVNANDSTITMAIPEGCFEYLTNSDGQPVATDGNVAVQVSDSETGASLDGVTVAAVRTSDDIQESSAITESGEATLNLRSDNYYYLTASKDGYTSYTGGDARFYVLPNDMIAKSIQLVPLASPAAGRLQVCASSGQTPLTSGRVSVMEVGGSEVAYTYLNPSDNGCVTFEDIAPGKMVRVTIVSPPAGCVSPGFSQSVTIAPGETNNINLDVSCGSPSSVAFVKVIVHDRTGHIQTSNSTITLWNAVTREQIPGSAPDSSLSLGSGGYTEEITVPANTLIQAKATAPPLGYIDTPSGPTPFTPGEHGSIDIVLGETSRGEFNFLGASIVYTPATPGSPVQVFVQQIKYNQTVLTRQNSNVVMLIDGQEYNATYMSG